jgi:class 3 adenylate cyclase
MPNFARSARLRQNYAPSYKTTLRDEGRLITESLNRYGTQGTLALNQLKAMSPSVSYLANNPNVELAMLFIDITDFSLKTANMAAPAIAKVLDAYYEEVMPAIYEYNGEVEKVMGDGIVAVFGPPFTPGTYAFEWLQAAERCADKIGQSRYRQSYTVKIALHYGKLMYYRNDNTTIDEFYAIGRPMTELFRLEGEGIDKKITYYVDSRYDTHRKAGHSILSTWWSQGSERSVSLKGVPFSRVIDLT